MHESNKRSPADKIFKDVNSNVSACVNKKTPTLGDPQENKCLQDGYAYSLC